MAPRQIVVDQAEVMVATGAIALATRPVVEPAPTPAPLPATPVPPGTAEQGHRTGPSAPIIMLPAAGTGGDAGGIRPVLAGTLAMVIAVGVFATIGARQRRGIGAKRPDRHLD
jgi:hypothetical protein